MDEIQEKQALQIPNGLKLKEEFENKWKNIWIPWILNLDIIFY